MNSSVLQRAGCILLNTGIFFLILAGCTTYTETSTETRHTDTGLPFSELMRARVEEMRSSGLGNVIGKQITAIDLITDAYTRNGFQRLWAHPQAVEQLMTLIKATENEGLNPEDYLLSFISSRLAKDTGSGVDEINRELLLSDAFFRLAYHFYYGKTNPEKLDNGWNFRHTEHNIDSVSLLLQATKENNIYESLLQLLPEMPHYAALRNGLKRYRSIEYNGGWAPVPPGPRLKNGMTSDRVPWLASRLQATGDLVQESSFKTDVFSAEVEQALIHFQQRHGLKADGIAGPDTIATLNVPVANRIEQLRANMERLRWVSHHLPQSYLLVDIAGFRAKLFLHGKESWSVRAQVGKPYRASPVFRADMTYLVLNPSWTVPPVILKHDFFPKLREDSSLLQEKRLSVIDHSGNEIDPASIDWTSVTLKNFNYKLRQKPGPGNALGRIKFMFPNSYFVYLHDTPSKQLFKSSQRAFSSGCIRIENPLELAELLLQSNEGWDRRRLEHEIATGQTRTVKLDQPIPVLLMYFTAEAREDSTILFRKDLYSRDRRIIDALNRPLSQNAMTDIVHATRNEPDLNTTSLK